MVVAFNDINPQAAVHILVIPRKHIKDYGSLKTNSEEDYKLLSHMKEVGENLLKQHKPDAQYLYIHLTNRLGFHRKIATMIKHLHLHCLATPWTSTVKSTLLFNWMVFVEVDNVLKNFKSITSL